MKNKSTIILESLLNGIPIRKEEHEYVLSEDNYLCLVGYNYNKGVIDKTNKISLKVNLGIELRDFINWANTFSNDEIAMISANNVLNRLNKRSC